MAVSQNTDGKSMLQELQEESKLCLPCDSNFMLRIYDFNIVSLSFTDSLQPIFSDPFDSKAFATQIIQYQAVGETLGKLESSITKLDDELYRQVCVRAYACAYLLQSL